MPRISTPSFWGPAPSVRPKLKPSRTNHLAPPSTSDRITRRNFTAFTYPSTLWGVMIAFGVHIDGDRGGRGGLERTPQSKLVEGRAKSRFRLDLSIYRHPHPHSTTQLSTLATCQTPPKRERGHLRKQCSPRRALGSVRLVGATTREGGPDRSTSGVESGSGEQGHQIPVAAYTSTETVSNDASLPADKRRK